MQLAFNHDLVKNKAFSLCIMSKVYPALLKRFTICLKVLEKFGFPMILLNLHTKSTLNSGLQIPYCFFRLAGYIRSIHGACDNIWKMLCRVYDTGSLA